MVPSVLLVDDERDFVDTLATRLGLRGLEAKAAYDGDQALARLAEQDFDVVVLDIQLPGRSGLELMEEVRALRPMAQVILLTGQSSLATAVEGMKKGALDYLLKPVDIEVLAAAIRQAGERRRAKSESRRMIEAGRLVALGHLARGVAHEINNPVNNMVTAAEWMLDLLAEENEQTCRNLEELLASAAVVRDNGMRCKDVTLRLLTYCGAGDPRSKDFVPEELLSAILARNAERARRLMVAVELDCAPALPVLHAPAAELDEAVSALVDNALDAMEGVSGRLRITARADAAALTMTVADTGQGIPPERLPHIFDPFFSTKETGTGAGLGLAICQRVITGLGGSVRVDNHEGPGCTFTVTLPLK